MPVRYAVQIDPKWEDHAGYAIELLLEGIGALAVRVENPVDAELVYSYEKPPTLPGASLWVQADQVRDWNAATARVGWLDDLPLLYQNQPPASTGDASNDVLSDIVYSTYALVTGALEQQQQKNAWGVPIAQGSFLQQAGVLEAPAVARCAEHLAAKLRRQNPGFQPTPRWPNGKQYAVVLSHDVDQPFSYPVGAYLRRLRNLVRQSAWMPAGRSLAGLTRAAALRSFHPLSTGRRDPNFCFDAWMELQARLTAKSCFYMGVTNSGDPAGAPVDVNYDFRHPAIVGAMHQAIGKGWEIGLHASVNARQDPIRFAEERQLLEAELDGYKLKGLRHHYWATDAETPERTLWAHASAGFEYDSSLGLNDSPGLRRGMTWPFRPFDRERARIMPILEVPPTLMDGGIFYRDVTAEEGAEAISAHLHAVFKAGGAAVLDWHLEQCNPARLRGAGPVLSSVLLELAGDSNIFWASPAELADWWQTRAERLQ